MKIESDMVPDKIYVGVGTLSSIQPAEEYAFPGWQEKPYSQIRSEEYIRKDAILEWLDGKMTIEGATEGFIGGYDMAMKDVIDKINSL